MGLPQYGQETFADDEYSGVWHVFEDPAECWPVIQKTVQDNGS